MQKQDGMEQNILQVLILDLSCFTAPMHFLETVNQRSLKEMVPFIMRKDLDLVLETLKELA